jgi:GNAT superfamily N-acetyltransferase
MDEIRSATVADAQTLARIHIEGWQAAYQQIVPPELMASRTVESRTREFVDLFAAGDEGDRFWLFERDGKPAALAYTRVGRDSDIASGGELKLFYTLPELKGGGIGLRLFEHATGDLVRRGMAPYLYTFRDNVAARAWYERRGWRADGASAPWSDRGEWPELVEVRYVAGEAR